MEETPKTIEPPEDFNDPREDENFLKKIWPLCNGNDAPLYCEVSSDLHIRRCIELLSALYHVNRTNAALLSARQSGAGEGLVSVALEEVGQAMDALEIIEDRYTPVGFYGEPSVMDGVFYRDIKFIRPGLPQLPPASASSASSHVRIPGLEFLPESELKGVITIERWL
jgi:hypothetical protein